MNDRKLKTNNGMCKRGVYFCLQRRWNPEAGAPVLVWQQHAHKGHSLPLSCSSKLNSQLSLHDTSWLLKLKHLRRKGQRREHLFLLRTDLEVAHTSGARTKPHDYVQLKGGLGHIAFVLGSTVCSWKLLSITEERDLGEKPRVGVLLLVLVCDLLCGPLNFSSAVFSFLSVFSCRVSFLLIQAGGRKVKATYKNWMHFWSIYLRGRY